MRPENGQGATRRTVIRTAAMVGTTAALATAGAALGAGGASAAPLAPAKQGKLPYPPHVTDTSHCTPEVAEIFRGFYSAKSEHNAAKLMSYFSKTNAYYIDAILRQPVAELGLAQLRSSPRSSPADCPPTRSPTRSASSATPPARWSSRGHGRSSSAMSFASSAR